MFCGLEVQFCIIVSRFMHALTCSQMTVNIPFHRFALGTFLGTCHRWRGSAFILGSQTQLFYKKADSKNMTSAAGKRIFVARQIVKPALDILNDAGVEIDMWSGEGEPTKEEILARVPGVDAIYSLGPQCIDKDVIDAAGQSLKVVSVMAVGVDAVDVLELKKRGIRLGHTPGVLTDAVADIAVTLILASTRRALEMCDKARNGNWKDWAPFSDLGVGLRGSTVGIVGLGRIGIATVKRLRPFGVHRFLYNARSEKAEGKEINASFTSFEDLLQQSDFVVACCSMNASTKEMFDRNAFSLMKRSAVFVNIGRGALVQQDDLIAALQNGEIRAAGLDVTSPEPLPPDNPLFKMKNCIVLPHIGSAEEQTRTDMATLAAGNLVAALRNEAMPAEYPL